jgi:ubiquinone/menaquinone biosynthesis C-methylase UbiE
MFHPEGPTLAELTWQALTSTSAGYDLLAPKFDHTPFRTPHEVLLQVADVIGLPGSIGNALDVCCGTGAGMIMLRPLCVDEVVGIDFSEGMLTEARIRFDQAQGSASGRFVQGDVREMVFAEEFDLVTCFGAFGHIQKHEKPAFVRSIHRALKPGGRFAFVTSEMPTPASTMWWAYRGFNAVMRVRNQLMKPEFIMYYLNFTVPEILPMFNEIGFIVKLHDAEWDRRHYKIAIATKV